MTEYFCVLVLVLAVEVTSCSLSVQWITWSWAADLFDSSLLQLSAAAWQQSFSLVAKTVKFIPSHSSNCHRGESESRLSHLWEMAAHDNDPAHFSSLSCHNKTVQGHDNAGIQSFITKKWPEMSSIDSTLQRLCVRTKCGFSVTFRVKLWLSFRLKYLNSYWLDFHEAWFRDSCSPQDESQLFNRGPTQNPFSLRPLILQAKQWLRKKMDNVPVPQNRS